MKILPKHDSNVISIKERISELLQQYKENNAKEVALKMQSAPNQSAPIQGGLQVSYTTTEFPFKPFTSISAIYDAQVPGKFKLKAKVIDIYPQDIKKFITGVCDPCSNLVNIPEEIISNSINGSISMQCPKCKDELLRITYTFKMLLLDDTGVIKVIVHDKEAVYFFNNTKPSMLIQDGNLLINFKNKLEKLVGGDLCIDDIDTRDTDNLPFIELCLFSYTSPQKIAYSLFSTSLI